MSSRATVDTFKKKLLASTKDREKRRSYDRAIDDVVALNEERFAAQGKFLGNFTSHGPDHSDRMLKHVIDLLPLLKRTKTSLTHRELFILGLSVYMHDLGMTVPLSPRDYDRCKNDDERWILRRKRHADAIEQVVAHEADTSLAFLRETECTLFDEFLVDLCRAH